MQVEITLQAPVRDSLFAKITKSGLIKREKGVGQHNRLYSSAIID